MPKNKPDEARGKCRRTLDSSAAVCTQREAAKKLPPSDSLQPAFNKHEEIVALDGPLLYVMKGPSFKWLVGFLKPELNFPSPKTIRLQLEELATALIGQLRDSWLGSLHIIVAL